MTWLEQLRRFMARTDHVLSERCRWCGGRFVVHPGYDPISWRDRHEGWCPLSVDCPYCEVKAG
jgi:hypothetical protein